jgi:hypothetical protein
LRREDLKREAIAGTSSRTAATVRQMSRKSECLNPLFDRHIEPDAHDVIVAGELLAIYDGALDAQSRWG